ncbi:MAG: hypothetical protein NVS3B10_04690 [Polyangiales bacterium]
MSRRLAGFALVLGGVVWVQACGSSDDGSVAIPDDAGAEGGMVQPDASDGAVDMDTSTAVDASDTSDASDASDASTPDADAEAGSDGGMTLDGGTCDGGTVTVSAVTPQFGYDGSATAITISGVSFVSTPRAYLIDSAKTQTLLENVAFVSATSLTARVPSGLAPGSYDLAVEDPDHCAGILVGAFKVVANPVPEVLSVSPSQGTTKTDVDVVVTGCHFPANATLSTVDSAGTVVLQTNAAPVAGGGDPRCGGDPLYTMAGTILTHTKTLAVGAYLVRVTNPTDATFGDYSSFVVSNPSGNLSSLGWTAASSLTTGRRALGLTSARLDDANRFLYAIGGESAAGAPLGSIEVAQVDRFGQLGAWTTQKHTLSTPRSGLAVVHRGFYLYAIGGTSSTNGTAGAGMTNPSGSPLASIERAELLLPSGEPTAVTATPSVAAGNLAPGTYYYRVAAVLDNSDPATAGETLPSAEIVATLGAKGQIALTWAAPAVGSVAHYRIYRSAAADGASGSEVLLADNIMTTSSIDDGSGVVTAEKPNSLGATGPWLTQSTQLAHARLDAAATIAPDPTGALHVYVLGGWGQCGVGAAAAMNCYEMATLNDGGSTLGTFLPGLTTTAHARLRPGADAMTVANGPPTFAVDTGSASTAFIVVSGGKGNLTGANTVEYAKVTTGGVLGTWANPTGYSTERDGSQLLIAGGYGYALQGGTAPNTYALTSDQSTLATVTSTALTFSSWANAGANLATKLGRHGAVAESAYFYIAGGTTNDTDALTTVQQILH